MSDYCNCYELGSMNCTCGKPRPGYEDRARKEIESARHKGYNHGLAVGAERERARLIAILRSPCKECNDAEAHARDLRFALWLEGGGKP